MRRFVLGIAAAAALQVGMAAAGEEIVFEPLPPLDLDSVSPEFADEMFGRWAIGSVEGDRHCEIELLREPGTGGMQIDVDADCEAAFPVMADIAAWRLLEGWAVDLVDGERKTRIRFLTPDERYVAWPEIDGIATLERVPLD